jgi:glutamine amidotransferase
LTTVSVIDYGLGNLGSVANMLKRVGTRSRRVSSPAEVAESESVLLPGIGAFDTGMRLLHEKGLVSAIRDFAASGRPILGICLGMQLLLDSSEEGKAAGLGLVAGQSRRFPASVGMRVPHMGWNWAKPVRDDSLIADLPTGSRFYFVHSYYVAPDDEKDVLTRTEYGVPFASMIRAGNIMGAQFHPEKSHTFGMRVLANFAAI